MIPGGWCRVLVAARPAGNLVETLGGLGVDVLVAGRPGEAYAHMGAHCDRLHGLVIGGWPAADALELALEARWRFPRLSLVAVGGARAAARGVEELGGVALAPGSSMEAVLEALASAKAARPPDYERLHRRLETLRSRKRRLRPARAAAAVFSLAVLPGCGAAAQSPAALRYDSDRDGFVSRREVERGAWEEFGSAGADALATRSGLDGPLRGHPSTGWGTRVLAMADHDQDGRVSRDEYVRHVLDEFRRADRDGDERLDEDEAGGLRLPEF